MLSREVVKLVSRALAVIQAITALLDISYLPEKLAAWSRDVEELRNLPVGSHLFDYDTSLVREDRIYLAFLTFRIGLLCLATLLLWRCGPRIEKMLAFSPVKGQISNESGSV